MKLLDGEILGYVERHSPSMSAYEQIKLKEELEMALDLVRNDIAESKQVAKLINEGKTKQARHIKRKPKKVKVYW